MKVKILFIALFFAGGILVSGQESPENFRWPGTFKAAVCLTYDDGLDCHLDIAAPALDTYGFKGTFYCTGSSNSLHTRLEEWRDLTVRGHELGNHSIFHPCDGSRFDWVRPEYDLRNYNITQLRRELFTANTLLQAIDGKATRTYAYTCSDFKVGDQIFIDSIRSLFFAARGDGPIPQSMKHVDLYFMPSWGVSDPSGSELIDYVKEAVENGTMAIFMFHSVGGGYLNVSIEAHNELLSYLDQHKHEIWTDTFLNITKYIKDGRY